MVIVTNVFATLQYIPWASKRDPLSENAGLTLLSVSVVAPSRNHRLSLNVHVDCVQISETAFQHASFVLEFVHPLTGILVSRFLLDLQSTNRESLHLDSTLATQETETIVFGRAVFTLETSETFRSLKHFSVDSISVYSQ
ncbi:hypothetical protein GSI_12510 [Ganoderma sinense ZZ0214-1]|uniref:Uncharacterized protein n=1 Tax=Ganoderma sinense ZZ0214-1 TaxID=1077348 RepID=A0A2G8RSY4_9APHY|nr:hypothetical protein GSI_12510 [Ganoderma sinense ZZ0214-1]